MHEKGNYDPKDLQTEQAYKDLMNQTFDAFNFAITDNDMSDVMRNALQQDTRLFGGLKTHAQLFEASKLLIDEKGNLKPFNQLSHEFDKLNITYNKNYLESEYEFAVGSSQMAAKWEEFSDNDRYELQYRTAGDNRVRAEHDALRDITLPKSDHFWNSYTPPNGWNCRCTVVEVLKDKFPTSDSEKAIKKGEAATTQLGKDGKNRLEIFRFNPGAQKVVFPPAHPYTKVAGAKAAKPIILTVFNSQTAEELKALRKAKDLEIKEWGNSVIKRGHHLTIKSKELKTSEVRVSRKNIESLSKHISDVSNKEAIKDIEKIINKGTFLKSKKLENKDPKNYGAKVARGVESYNYYKSEWNGKTVEINMEVMKDGYEQPYAILFDKI